MGFPADQACLAHLRPHSPWVSSVTHLCCVARSMNGEEENAPGYFLPVPVWSPGVLLTADQSRLSKINFLIKTREAFHVQTPR